VNGLVCLALLLGAEMTQPRYFDEWMLNETVRAARSPVVLFAVVLLGQQRGAQFIYFQF
jgi:hypothetical protein